LDFWIGWILEKEDIFLNSALPKISKKAYITTTNKG
jgi:hypothetical protein